MKSFQGLLSNSPKIYFGIFFTWNTEFSIKPTNNR